MAESYTTPAREKQGACVSLSISRLNTIQSLLLSYISQQMGLLTLLTGKDQITRQLEKLDKEMGDKYFEITAKHATELNLHGGEQVAAAAAGMTLGTIISQFATHYVRSKLDYHPKWATEGNFRDEAHALVLFSAVNFRVLFRSSLDNSEKAKFVHLMTSANEESPELDDLMKNMFRCVDLERLLKSYPKETSEALGIMASMHKEYALKSVHEFSHEEYTKFLQQLLEYYF